MSIDSAAFLGTARAILDRAAISDSDRLSFFENVGAAVGNERAALSVDPEQREPWARALMAVASALLVPEPPVLPQHGTDSEVITAELTASEFEVWDAEFRTKLEAPADVDFDAPDSNAEEEEEDDGDGRPAKEDDDFDDFVIDTVEEIE
jgi:hypothetical protein